MDNSGVVILSPTASLHGRDLASVFGRARAALGQPLPTTPATAFKKKEPLANMAKSILKHRLNMLTGLDFGALEKALGFDSLAGRVMEVEALRMVAHFLIVEANRLDAAEDAAAIEAAAAVVQPPPAVAASQKPPPLSARRALKPEPAAAAAASPGKHKRGRLSMAALIPSSSSVAHAAVQPPPPPSAAESAARRAPKRHAAVDPQLAVAAPAEVVVKPKRGRQSMAPAIPATVTSAAAAAVDSPRLIVGAKKGRSSLAPNIHQKANGEKSFVSCRLEPGVRESAAVVAAPEARPDPKLGLVNPTPEMLRQKRKSLSKSPQKNFAGVATATSKLQLNVAADDDSEEMDTEERSEPRPADVVVRRRKGFPGGQNVEIYLVNGLVQNVSNTNLGRLVPSFPGAHLTVLHTPTDWNPANVFTLVQSVRALNREAGLASFLVLIGTGIDGVHLTRDALKRQTQHVQFIVIERNDKNLARVNDGKLRETTSFWLLAYFFPGCSDANRLPPTRMAREGNTTCFKAENIEDLENTIVHNLSEPGDWILDLSCGKRELSIAAQKTGRFAIAVDEDLPALQILRGKAAAVAAHHDQAFTPERDGTILDMTTTH